MSDQQVVEKETSNGSGGAIVAIVAIVVLLVVGFFALQFFSGDKESSTNTDVNVTTPAPDLNPTE